MEHNWHLTIEKQNNNNNNKKKETDMNSRINHWSETKPGDGQHLRLPPKTASRLVRWGLCGLLLALVWASPALATPVSPPRVLVLAATSWPASSSSAQEIHIAQALGFIVDVVSDTTWSSIQANTGAPFDSTKGFSAYRAIILCDLSCNSTVSALNAAVLNRSVWSSVAAGNVIIDGADFTFHANGSPAVPAKTFITNAINFATADANNTGLFIQLSCYYYNATPGTPVPVLDKLSLPANQTGPLPNGPFTVRKSNLDAIWITAAHPALSGLTSTLLSNFGQSTHETFDTWPKDFIPLAICTDSSFKNYSGGSPVMSGTPYIMVRGTNVTLVGSCLCITNKSVDCISTNGTYAWNFCVTNCWNHAIQYISFPDLPPGVTINSDVHLINPALQPGQGTCLTLYLTNTVGPTNFCFTIGVIATNFVECCSTTNCLTLVPCCNYFTNAVPHSIPGQPNCYTLSLAVKNVSQPPMDVSYLFLTSDPFNCLAFTPDVIPLIPKLKPNETRVISTKLCTTCPSPWCFYVTLWNTNLSDCCSTRHCLPKPITPPIALSGLADGTVFTTPADIPLAVDLSGGIEFVSVTYVASGQVIAVADTAPFSAIWSNAPPGDYVLHADGSELNSGGYWTSDPVAIYVVTPQTSTNLLAAPILVKVAFCSGGLSFQMQTVSGVTYQVESSDSIVSPSWLPVEVLVGDGNPVVVGCSCTNAPQKYYRVRAQAQ